MVFLLIILLSLLNSIVFVSSFFLVPAFFNHHRILSFDSSALWAKKSVTEINPSLSVQLPLIESTKSPKIKKSSTKNSPQSKLSTSTPIAKEVVPKEKKSSAVKTKKENIDINNEKIVTKKSKSILGNVINNNSKNGNKEAMHILEALIDEIGNMKNKGYDFNNLLGDDNDNDDDESSSSSSDSDPDLLNGVIRVYCTHSQPNFGMPWQRQKQEFSTSTGFVIDGNRILTNAHAVEYGSLIQVKKRQSEDKYVATVTAVGHECDLAILSVEDSSFWEDVEPLQFGNIPNLLEDVSVVGYPVGGDSISITSGVVSRIEMQEYAQASAELLAIQIDAAINPGNSGGPVVNDKGEVIGVAFQSLSEDDVENIGYVVPVNVINHFLDDVKLHGSYSGVCGVGMRLQGMENDELRSYFNMTKDDTGVVVLSVAPLAPASSFLKKGDVVLTIDGIRVANDGTIPFREGKGRFKERVHLSYYFTQRFASDVVEFEILRQGKRLKVNVPLWVPQQLVPRVLLQKKAILAEGKTESSIVGGVPSYLMVGGLVLVSLSREYLQTEFSVEHMGDYEAWAEEFRIVSLADNTRKVEGEEVVLLSQVIAHSCNIGYETRRNLRLVTFNQKPVLNLAQLKRDIDALTSSSKTKAVPLIFEFSNGNMIVLDSAAAKNAREQICQDHLLPSFCSADLI